MNISEKDLRKILSKSLNVKINKITETLNSNSLEEWDSLGQLSIISSLDKKFKGKVNFSKLSNFDNYKDIKNFLIKKSLMK